jgi:peptidoglycan hydrolase-like protein with peptidoglycan-binding domain
MKHLCVVCFALVFAASLRADDQLRAVQQTLKDQGFYYGEVDGEEGMETNAAVRRYQIRNGLEVTGKLNDQVLASLGLGGNAKSPGKQPVAQPPHAPVASDGQDDNTQAAAPQPPAPRKQPNVVESDKNFLRQHPPQTAPAVQPPDDDNTVTAPPPPEPRGTDFTTIFRRTPYERAPLEVQRSTLKRAQVRLAREGFYRGAVDGQPGPDTQRAIAAYQRDADLSPSGRLDMDTLTDMNLLPTRRAVFPAPASPYEFDEPPVVGRRVYRGIWIR